MSVLDSKVPPPVVALAVAAMMRAGAAITPAVQMPGAVRIAAVSALAGAGLAIELAGAVSFARARTTADPTHPLHASALVTTGMYRFTRNPMYVGDLLMLLAWGVWLSSPVAALIAFAFVAYIDTLQIAPEERALGELFGDEYARYRVHVRRWL
jgi:protein-S-isoprenylcysteine O-methyltransferase Ste14